MKQLPKEFQFKCDENSLEQCEKLGIDTDGYALGNYNCFYNVINNKIERHSDVYLDRWENLISLADYIEEESDIKRAENPIGELQPPDHSDLIVELTGKYVAEMMNATTTSQIIVRHCIDMAEETVKQLKEKKYL